MINKFAGPAVIIYSLIASSHVYASEADHNFFQLARQCAPEIHQDTLRRIVDIESSFNPFAIGVVGGRLERQPNNREEAIATAQWLESNGFNYSVGLAQINKKNFRKHGLTFQTAFETCPNLRAGAEILKDCFIRAKKNKRNEQEALQDAFSCYYSGNFITGYKLGYVKKIVGRTGHSREGFINKSRYEKKEAERSQAKITSNNTHH